ncbi:peptidase U32 family protein [Desulfonema magnum]|uniref:Peptidase U32 domain-containing protein n=1 Tax=Desulfonema magnum TaxID=45655 RepID=A0A975BSA7_9BACT|nr:U32 family peptidase [Desulfonema magnum]QTA90766.1 Peptidase U32 domain-containing protein [Desulfonema magnum]
MTKTNKKTELLAPAGNFEKLEIAVHYGADAVYLAGKDFSLRNFSENFTPDEMRQAVKFAHKHGVKVYVACNIYPRNYEQKAIADHLGMLGEMHPDAVIVADPGIFMEARKLIPQIPLHLSTQANTTSYKSAQFWESLGAKRVNVARELSLKEIKEIVDNCSLETEAFVHGALCISYSGRCLLSTFMAKRDSNRGMCCHPCRFRYTLMEEKRPGQYFPIAEDDRGAYIFNSKDLCMIEHIPEMIEAGVTSLKIEGRMKGINYVGSAVKVYREAIDTYYKNPEHYKIKEHMAEELAKMNYRGYCTGFYLGGDPDQVVPNYTGNNYQAAEHVFVAKVIENAGPGRAIINVRNKIFKGDEIEILTKKGPVQTDKIDEIVSEDGEFLPFAQPNSTVTLLMNTECSPNDLIRKIRYRV